MTARSDARQLFHSIPRTMTVGLALLLTGPRRLRLVPNPTKARNEGCGMYLA